MTSERGDTATADTPNTTDRSRRRLAILAIIVVALVTASIAFARFAALERGSSSSQPTTTTDAWDVDHAFFSTWTTVIARNEYLASLDLRMSIRNGGPFGLRMLDAESVVRQWDGPGCGWRPISAAFFPPVWSEDDPDRELEPPFTLAAGEEVAIAIAGELGDPELGPCPMEGISWFEIEVPLRYSFLGIPRTQYVPLNMIIAQTDDPDPWLQLHLTELGAGASPDAG